MMICSGRIERVGRVRKNWRENNCLRGVWHRRMFSEGRHRAVTDVGCLPLSIVVGCVATEVAGEKVGDGIEPRVPLFVEEARLRKHELPSPVTASVSGHLGHHSAEHFNDIAEPLGLLIDSSSIDESAYGLARPSFIAHIHVCLR